MIKIITPHEQNNLLVINLWILCALTQSRKHGTKSKNIIPEKVSYMGSYSFFFTYHTTISFRKQKRKKGNGKNAYTGW